MRKRVCLDTGILSIFFSNLELDKKLKNLVQQARENKLEIHILKPILVEVFHQLCKIRGKEVAKLTLMSFLNTFPIKEVNLDDHLIFSAGIIKCQHRKRLSYNDSLLIAYCLNNKIEMHTTEKRIKDIPNNTLDRLKIIKYDF